MPVDTIEDQRQAIRAIPEDVFQGLILTPEPVRAVLTHIYGAEATNDIETFGESRWDDAWATIIDRA